MRASDQKKHSKRLVLTLGPMLVVACLCARTEVFSYLQNLHSTICPFYNLFHRPCPSCGMTMGILHTIRFEFHEATVQNPFSPFVLLGTSLVFLHACFSLFTTRIPSFPPKTITVLAFLSSATVVVLWITRLLPTL